MCVKQYGSQKQLTKKRSAKAISRKRNKLYNKISVMKIFFHYIAILLTCNCYIINSVKVILLRPNNKPGLAFIN